jgi:glycosyltransferase involved in cell wall biosynthesis
MNLIAGVGFLEAARMLKKTLLAAALNGDRQPALPPDFKLSVLMPVYNECQTIKEILNRVRAVALPKEIILVDDGSSDGTRDVLRNEVEGKLPDVRVIYHERNRGKGAAVRTAIHYATGSICVIQDADLETDPNDYFCLIEPIVTGYAEVVYGSRFIQPGARRTIPYRNYVGNRVLTIMSNLVTNLSLTDMETCYKVIPTELLKSFHLSANGFNIEPELTAQIGKARVRVYEVPVSYSPRTNSAGKKIKAKAGFQAIYYILRYHFGK